MLSGASKSFYQAHSAFLHETFAPAPLYETCQDFCSFEFPLPDHPIRCRNSPNVL